MISYINKCATCKSFEKAKGKRKGQCLNKNSKCSTAIKVTLGRTKCVHYSFDNSTLCKCGIYKEEDFNYCPKCGEQLKNRF